MENIRIDTAQNVGIDYEIASIGDRITAFVIDTLGVKLGYVALILIAARYVDGFSGLLNQTFFVFAVFLPLFFYDLAMEIFNDGQSLGKRAMKIKVVMTDGSQPGIGSYLLRWVFRVIELDTSAGSIALWAYLFSQKGQRLGDLAAGTTVVKLKDRDFRETIFENVDRTYIPSFAQSIHLSDIEAGLIREVLSAFDQRDIKRQNFDAIAEETRNRIAARLEIQSDMGPMSFLDTVLKDYNHLHGKLS